MRKSNKYVIMAFLFIVFSGFLFKPMRAQNHNRFWKFGRGQTLDFNSIPPVHSFSMFPFSDESSASVSDPLTGQLLLVAGLDSIYNKNLQSIGKMSLNFNGLDVQQCVIIVPMPENDSLFYYFINGYKIDYGIVNVKGNNGYGSIIFRGNLLNNTNEALTFTKHCNERDYWIIAKDKSQFPKIYSYLLSPTGLNTTPILSNGIIPNTYPVGGDQTGLIKVSPNGKHLISTFRLQQKVEMYGFDNGTGICTGLFSTDVENPAGVEFSASSELVYMTVNTGWSKFPIDQYSANSIDASSWQASKKPIETVDTNYAAGLMLGIDKKIYVSGRKKVNGIELPTLGVINNPNEIGNFCNLNMRQIDPIQFYNPFDIPNLNSYQKHKPLDISHSNISKLDCLTYYCSTELDTNDQYESCLWIMGDGTFYSSNMVNHQFASIPNAGRIVMNIVNYTKCLADTFTFTIFPCPTDSSSPTDSSFSVLADTLFIPNAFTPNADGLNDVIRLHAKNATLNSFKIFNRWGSEVFTTTDLATGWNGTYRGNPCEIGTYYYFIEFTNSIGRKKTIKGDIQLLR